MKVVATFCLVLLGSTALAGATETQPARAPKVSNSLQKGFFRTFGADAIGAVAPLCSSGMENALPQQIEAGAAVHTAFDELEAVDLSLDRTIAPGLDDGCGSARLGTPIGSEDKPYFADGNCFMIRAF